MPLAGPMILGAVTDVEERTVALEARAFSAPARRTVIRPIPDTGWERALRWAMGLGAVALVAAGIAGVLRFP